MTIKNHSFSKPHGALFGALALATIDGRYGYPSTGEVIDVASKKIVTALADENGHPVMSEKMVEVDFARGAPLRAGDQFGVGRAKP